MKQFKTILKFEIANYFKSKVFIGFTICLVIIIGVLMFFPRITAQSNNSADSNKSTDNLPVMYILSEDSSNSEITKAFQEAFSDYEIKIAADEKEIRDQINSGNAECGFQGEEQIHAGTERSFPLRFDDGRPLSGRDPLLGAVQ